LKEIGSIESDDLQNFKLYINGVEVAGPVQMSDDFYVTFDLTSSPVSLEAGSRTIEVRADVIDGSSKSFSFSLWYTADVVLEDSQYNVSVIPTKGGSTFTPATTGTISVNSGSLSITRAVDSPSGTIVPNTSNVVLAKYTFTAYGESIKVTSLKFGFTTSDGNVTKLRNGKVYADGVQIGSTADLLAAGTTYNLGSALIVEPGNPVTVEVRADIYDNDGTNDISANDTITARLYAVTNNAQRMTSMTLLSAPASNTDGYQLTVSTGALTLVKDTSHADQTTTGNVQGLKIGAFVLTAGSAEDVNITRFTVNLTYTDTTGDGDTVASTLNNLYVKYGDVVTTPKATVSGTNYFTVTHTLPASNQLKVEIYADVNSTVDATDTLRASLAVDATGASTGTSVSVTTAVPGQLITFANASFSAAFTGEPLTGFVVAEAVDAPAGTYKFTAQNADIVLNEIYLKVVNPTYARVIKEVGIQGVSGGVMTYIPYAYFDNAATVNETNGTVTVLDDTKYSNGDVVVLRYSGCPDLIGIVSNAGGSDTSITVTVNGSTSYDMNCDGDSTDTAVTPVEVSAYIYVLPLGLNIAKNTYETITITADVNDVTSNAVSGDQIQFVLAGYKYSVNNVPTTVLASTNAGLSGTQTNALIVRNTYPTVELAMSSTSGTVYNGQSTEVYKFTISAHEHADVAVKQMKFAVSLVDQTTDDTLTLGSFKLYRGSTDITSYVAITTADGATDLKSGNITQAGGATGTTNETVIVRFLNEEVIPADGSYTYTLKATPGGFTHDSDNDYFTVQMLGDSSSTSYSYLLDGDSDASQIVVKLSNAAGSASTAANFIWSDNSGIPHNYTVNDNDGTPGSSGDWTNGYLVEELSTMSTATFTY